jgi:CheY-like chemotaxis protein
MDAEAPCLASESGEHDLCPEKRILIADDDPGVLFIMRAALLGLGEEYEVVAAKDGVQALDHIQRHPFDLVVTDLRMPGMDGVELTEAIRADCPETAVIWMTAYGTDAVRADGQRLGVALYLDKPLRIAGIRQAVAGALSGPGGAAA